MAGFPYSILVILDTEKKQRHNQPVKDLCRNREDAVYDPQDLVVGILFEAAGPKMEAKRRNLKTRAPRFLPASIKGDPKRISITKIVKATNAIATRRGKFGFGNQEADNDMPLSDSLPATSLPDEAAIYGREEDRINIPRLLLPDLHGSLSVSELQNVSPASDASEANLKAMRYLDERELEWSGKNEDPATDQKEVLENLKPSVELKKLSTRFYGAKEFPKWLGDSSFSKIISLHLSDCSNCKSLPPLGRLSSLEHLIIERIRGIKSIGHEFYGVDASGCKAFKSLKTLKFVEMSQWEEWMLLEEDGEEFSCLEEFYVINCPLLKGDLPKSLPTLVKLEICNCEQLEASLPQTSERCALKLENCWNGLQLKWRRITEILAVRWLEVSALSKIRFLCISDYNNCSSLPPFGQLPFLEHLAIQRIGGVRSIGPEFYRMDLTFRKPFQSLKTLKLEAMLQWERWTPLEVQGEEFPCLQEFYIINCPKLEGDLPKCLPFLIKLEISKCQQLAASLPWTSEQCLLKLDNCDKVQKRNDDNQTTPSSSDDENQQFSSTLSINVSSIGTTHLMELPTDLHSLRIERYASHMLPEVILKRSSLQHLYIIDCISLEIFPQSPSLETLYIHNCKKLKFPQPSKVMNQDARLEDLCLGSSCDSLKIFPLNYFPKLKSLSLWDCRNLEHLSIEKGLQNELTSLDSLEIKDCPNLRSFLEEEFQAPNLTSLVFFNCGSLKSLPGMQSIKSLQSVYINKCPALESLPVEGLPSSLIVLCICFCDKITPQKGWKLDNLHSLSHFEIEGGCHGLESFPEEGLLPTNLNSLRISRLSDLKFLDREGLQKLTSLQTLELNCCDKLDSLPEHGLPSSLYSLSITDCSLLNPKLQNRKGREWFKIARVPSIHLDEVSD